MINSLMLARLDIQFESAGHEASFPSLLPLLIFGIAAVGVLMGGSSGNQYFFRRRKTPSATDLGSQAFTRTAGPGKPDSQVRATSPLGAKSSRERRASLRRAGNPVPVLLSSPATPNAPSDGVVLDRSRHGLLVAVGRPMPVGTRLNVRAAHAPDELAWIPIEVRNCRQKDDRWLLGCKLKRELPWTELLLFG